VKKIVSISAFSKRPICGDNSGNTNTMGKNIRLLVVTRIIKSLEAGARTPESECEH
jgi:hypothetical protein